VRLFTPSEVGGHLQTELPRILGENKEEIDDHILCVIDPADFRG